MANELGTASGELSLDAQKFIKSIQDANTALDRFDAQWNKSIASKGGQTLGGDPAKLAASGAAWRDLGNKIDGAGRQAMIGMRSLGDVASLAGMNREMTAGITAAAGMADAIGDLSGVMAAISPTMLAVSVAAAGIGVALVAANAASKQNAEFIRDLVQPYNDLYEAIKKVNAERQLEKNIGFKTDDLMAYGKTSEQAGSQVETFLRQTKDLEKLKAKRELWKSFEDGTIASKWRAGVAGIEGAWEDLTSFLEGKPSDALNFEKLHRDIANLEASLRGNRSPIDFGLEEARAAKIQLEKQEKAQARFVTLSAQFDKAKTEAARRKVEIEQDLADRSKEIQANLGERITEIHKNLGSNLAGMQRDYLKQVASFAREEQRIHTDAAKAIESLERDTAKQIAQIDRDAGRAIAKVNQDEATSLAAVDNNLRKTLRNARSVRERREARREAAERKQEIVAQAAERRNEIAQQAAERKAELLERKAERLSEIAEQKRERLADLAEKRKLAAEEFAFRKAEATRVANEQITAARKAADEQIKAAERAAQKQKEAQQRALDEMEAELRQTASDAGMLGHSVGQSIGRGIAEGIDAENVRIQEAARRAVQAAYVASRNVAEIESPSKLFARKIGKPLAEGVLVGFNRTMNENARQMNLSFSHTWTGTSIAQFDRASIQRVAEDAAFRGIRIALEQD